MQPGTVALLVLGVAGAGAGYYFLVVRPRQQQQLQLTTSTAPMAGVSVSATTATKASAGLAGDHVDRKNALAPTIVSRITGLPTSTTSKITSIAGKLDVSSYAERYVSTKVPIVGKIAEAPVSVAKSIVGGIASLF